MRFLWVLIRFCLGIWFEFRLLNFGFYGGIFREGFVLVFYLGILFFVFIFFVLRVFLVGKSEGESEIEFSSEIWEFRVVVRIYYCLELFVEFNEFRYFCVFSFWELIIKEC